MCKIVRSIQESKRYQKAGMSSLWAPKRLAANALDFSAWLSCEFQATSSVHLTPFPRHGKAGRFGKFMRIALPKLAMGLTMSFLSWEPVEFDETSSRATGFFVFAMLTWCMFIMFLVWVFFSRKLKSNSNIFTNLVTYSLHIVSKENIDLKEKLRASLERREKLLKEIQLVKMSPCFPQACASRPAMASAGHLRSLKKILSKIYWKRLPRVNIC